MNKDKLRAVIIENGDNQSSAAEAIGISRVTFSRKVNEIGGACFTQPEIEKLVRRYHLTDRQTIEIFFACNVSESDTERKTEL